MGRMTAEATHDRPEPATIMIVRLATGDEFEANAEDFDKFGYAHTDTVITDWRKFIEAAIGTDLLSAGSVLPFWLALHQALNNPAS